eukprot:CAMPEP_0201573102 /NCGR_PEP_ID=MMETSP0190_2-20130828/16769_1 /ASSEMBLY_ACC=CAM_ASM_000263 /TAXON_ID=37353 /ORGANISM="Rosalina sp." /LENGTH=64 /DNA_ID=CAMNT_0047999665 /DNA_START=86 /DNA_END=277 /DNA_ORIENTATION=-
MAQQDDEKSPQEIHDDTCHVEIPTKMKNIDVDKVLADRGFISYVTIRISKQRLFEECAQAIPDS